MPLQLPSSLPRIPHRRQSPSHRQHQSHHTHTHNNNRRNTRSRCNNRRPINRSRGTIRISFNFSFNFKSTTCKAHVSSTSWAPLLHVVSYHLPAPPLSISFLSCALLFVVVCCRVVVVCLCWSAVSGLSRASVSQLGDSAQWSGVSRSPAHSPGRQLQASQQPHDTPRKGTHGETRRRRGETHRRSIVVPTTIARCAEADPTDLLLSSVGHTTTPHREDILG